MLFTVSRSYVVLLEQIFDFLPTMLLSLIHRGTLLAVSGDEANTLGELRCQVCATLSVPAENVRLLADGKLLSPTEDNTFLEQLLRPSQTVLVLATAPETVKNLREAKPDTTLRPFEAKTPKYVATPRKTPQTPKKYGFGTVSALPNLPDSSRAQQILEQLASDRGILAVMEKKRWYVGELREMRPEGRVGVDPVCVLGYNTNKGQQIHLRLRTDDMTGFRAMYSIRQVLAHELAHNEFSEHDDNFKELMRWIEKTAARDNWRSLGNRLDNGWDAPDFGMVSSSWTDSMGWSEENKLGSESGSTGVSRLLQAYETGSTKTEDTGGVGQVSVTAEDESKKMCNAQDEKEKERKVLGTDESDRNSLRAKQYSEWRKGGERCSALEEVMRLGFSRQLAGLALRENGGDASRAADWLLSERVKWEEHGDTGESEAETTQKVKKAVDSLEACLNDEELVSVLDTLHVYMSNILRHPGVERYCRINSSNRGFQRRVGVYGDAIEILRVVGFRLEEGIWRYRSLEVTRVWIAKLIVEERLVKELI